MTSTKFAILSALLRSRDDVEFGRPVTPLEVSEAETQLGTPFPTDYRMFLTEFGSLSIAHYQIYGLGAGIDDNLDVVKMTLEERADYMLPADLVAVMNDGGGNLICLDVGDMDDEICGVVTHWHDSRTTEPRAPSFSDFLYDLINDL